MAIEKKSLISNNKTPSTKSTVKATPSSKLRTASSGQLRTASSGQLRTASANHLRTASKAVTTLTTAVKLATTQRF
jgi:hypothetical protein